MTLPLPAVFRARLSSSAFIVSLVAVLLPGCSDRPLAFGPSTNFYFWTDHETGDLSDCTDKGPNGGFIAQNESMIDVEQGTSRSGSHALHARGVSPSVDGWTTAMVAQHRPLPNEAYYSAWFFLPEAVAPERFWILFLFRSRAEASGDIGFQNQLNLFLARADNAELRLVLDDGADKYAPPLEQLTVPVGRWFHLEAFQRIASDDSGRFSVWQDGTLLYDLAGPTSATPYVEWMLGVVVDNLTTPASDLYIDDAAITRRRLGPNVGPFTRE